MNLSGRQKMTLIVKKVIPLAASLLLLAGSPAFAARYHVVAVTYAPHLSPSSTRTDSSSHYCLSGESANDCGFTSLAQCEATASGGLGVCDMVAVGPLEHGPYASHASW